MTNRECQWDEAALELLLRSPLSHPLAILLVRDMCLIADDDGRAPLLTLATRFRNFFRKREQEGRAGLDVPVAADMAAETPLSQQSMDWWSAMIVDRVLPATPCDWLGCDGDYIAWNPQVWVRWSSGFRKALRNAAEIRLIQYFETRVEGGW